jgi:hypothetical protein
MPKAQVIADSVQSFLPALKAIDCALDSMEKRHRQPAENCERRLKSRTELYAMAVKQWPPADLQFVPNPQKWFSEQRYEHDEQSWQRNSGSGGFEAERDQISRLVQ